MRLQRPSQHDAGFQQLSEPAHERPPAGGDRRGHDAACVHRRLDSELVLAPVEHGRVGGLAGIAGGDQFRSERTEVDPVGQVCGERFVPGRRPRSSSTVAVRRAGSQSVPSAPASSGPAAGSGWRRRVLRRPSAARPARARPARCPAAPGSDASHRAASAHRSKSAGDTWGSPATNALVSATRSCSCWIASFSVEATSAEPAWNTSRARSRPSGPPRAHPAPPRSSLRAPASPQPRPTRPYGRSRATSTAAAWRVRPTANATEYLGQPAPTGATSRHSSGARSQERHSRRRNRTFVQHELSGAPHAVSRTRNSGRTSRPSG